MEVKTTPRTKNTKKKKWGGKLIQANENTWESKQKTGRKTTFGQPDTLQHWFCQRHTFHPLQTVGPDSIVYMSLFPSGPST